MRDTDQRFLNDLESALGTSPYLAGKRLRIENHAGQVVVRGRVGSYYQKQMAQEALLRVEGVEALANELEVHWA